MATYRRKTVNSLINSLYCLKLGVIDNKKTNNILDLMNQLKISSKRNNLNKRIGKKK